MFDVGVLALALGSVAVLAGLVLAGVVRVRSGPAVLLATWSACMATAVAFPIGDVWNAPTTAAYIHSTVAIIGFVSLPAA